MTKISALPLDTAPTLDDFTVTVDNGTGSTKKVTLSSLMSLMFANFDWSLNMKAASNTSAPTITTGANNNFASVGAQIAFTVASSCNCLVTVDVGMSSTSDYETRPLIYLDGVLFKSNDVIAAIGSASGRATERSLCYVVPLTAGAHIISAGGYTSAGGSQAVAINAAHIAGIVLGLVTA